MVFITHTQSGIGSIGRKAGCSLSFQDLQQALRGYAIIRLSRWAAFQRFAPIDKLSVVITLILAVIFLHEDFTVKSAIGAALITAGTILMVL